MAYVEFYVFITYIIKTVYHVLPVVASDSWIQACMFIVQLHKDCFFLPHPPYRLGVVASLVITNILNKRGTAVWYRRIILAINIGLTIFTIYCYVGFCLYRYHYLHFTLILTIFINQWPSTRIHSRTYVCYLKSNPPGSPALYHWSTDSLNKGKHHYF